MLLGGGGQTSSSERRSLMRLEVTKVEELIENSRVFACGPLSPTIQDVVRGCEAFQRSN